MESMSYWSLGNWQLQQTYCFLIRKSGVSITPLSFSWNFHSLVLNSRGFWLKDISWVTISHIQTMWKIIHLAASAEYMESLISRKERGENICIQNRKHNPDPKFTSVYSLECSNVENRQFLQVTAFPLGDHALYTWSSRTSGKLTRWSLHAPKQRKPNFWS